VRRSNFVAPDFMSGRAKIAACTTAHKMQHQRLQQFDFLEIPNNPIDIKPCNSIWQFAI
jgi:hypothetical protein